MIRRAFVLSLFALLFTAGASAQLQSNQIIGVAFLIGDWSGTGTSGNNSTDRGVSHIRAIVGGNGLLRSDHTDVTDASGKLLESFDQIMLIYPEGGTLHADYLDGTHAIHYTKATLVPGQSVRFESVATADTPAFRLTYTKLSADRLDIKFEMRAPGASGFSTIAQGSVTRD